MSGLRPFEPRALSEVVVEQVPVDADQVVAGAPRTGSTVLAELFGAEIGVWEMTAGAMVDIEVDEVFVVVEGEASVTLLKDGVPTELIELRAGTVCRLAAGSTTRWDVPRLLRKVYVLANEVASEPASEDTQTGAT